MRWAYNFALNWRSTAWKEQGESISKRQTLDRLVAKAHEKTVNTRNDFQHQLSRRLIDENQAICVETLKVKNMLKNRRLSKHIADAAWGELVRKLEYKAEWEGKHLVKIDPWFASSKTCSACGHKTETMPLAIRHWVCEECHTEHDRVINAAVNIRQQGIVKLKAEGLSVSACGGLRKSDSVSVAA
jgi:putative transposase